MTSGTWTDGTQGTNAFSAALNSTYASDSYTLLTADIPSHTHSFTTNSGQQAIGTGPNYAIDQTGGATTGATGGGGGHSHGISMDIKYLDFIIATKDA
jgi:hypothetical protein